MSPPFFHTHFHMVDRERGLPPRSTTLTHTQAQAYLHTVYVLFSVCCTCLCSMSLSAALGYVSCKQTYKASRGNAQKEEVVWGKRGLVHNKWQTDNQHRQKYIDCMPPTHSHQCATRATAEWAKDENLCTYESAHLASNPSPLTMHKQSVKMGGKTVHNFYTSR